jgi:hypothetical protein
MASVYENMSLCYSIEVKATVTLFVGLMAFKSGMSR